MLIGGYRDALSFPAGQKIIFNDKLFISTRPPSMQPYLEKMLQLQIFQQFIEGRLAMLSDGEGFNDEFEFEVNMYGDRNNHRLKTQYKEWLSGIKKEGTIFLKAVNPAMKSAYKQVRDKGRQAGKQARDKTKRAYKGIKNRLQDKSPTNHHRPRSAPSSPNASPTQSRRPSTSKSNDFGIKKSVSGIIATYADHHDGSASSSDTNSLHVNGNLRRPSENVVDDLINLDADDSFKYEPVNVSLMDELPELMLRRCSLTSPEVTSYGREAQPSTSPASATPRIPPPLPPPPVVARRTPTSLTRRSNMSDANRFADSFTVNTSSVNTSMNMSNFSANTSNFTLNTSSTSNTGNTSTNTRTNTSMNNLIQLESPPDNVLASFDPLIMSSNSVTFT